MRETGRDIRVAAALSLWLASSWMLNATLYADLGAMLPVARDVAQSCAACVALALAVVALRAPRVFLGDVWTKAAAFLTAAGAAGALAGVHADVLPVVFVCALLRSALIAWLHTLVGLAVAQRGAKRLVGVIACAFLAKYAWVALLSQMPSFLLEILFVAAAPIAALLAYPSARRLLDDVSARGSQASLEITSPASFVPFTHVFFVSILVFMIASGYALAFGASGYSPGASAWAVVPLACSVGLSFRKGALSSDLLYAMAALLIVAGLLFAGRPDAGAVSSLPWTRILLNAGSDCFRLLAWLVVSRLAMRNSVTALPALLFFSAAQNFGIEAGAALGHGVNAFSSVSDGAASFFSACALLAFVGYNLIVLKPFIFEATIAGVRPVSEPVVRESVPTLEASCLLVAERFRLTPRETEVCSLLARGRNAQAIQEKLVVSRNTVKTHVKNVYGKLGVHSQQELIDLVEGMR